MGFKYFGPLL